MRTDWHRRDFPSDRGLFRSRSGRFAAALPLLDASRPLSPEQVPARHEQIGQRTGHEQAIGVLRNAAVAYLVESEDALQNPNGVLDLGANARFGSILQSILPRELAIAPRLGLGEVARVRGERANRLGLAAVGGIAVDAGFSAVQQLG